MWSLRNRTWCVELHERGATARPLHAVSESDVPVVVAAESAIAAWLAICAALPPGSHLKVYLCARLAPLGLLSGGDNLSERDWLSLAQAHSAAGDSASSAPCIALDQAWRTGPRLYGAIDASLLATINAISTERHTVRSIEPSSLIRLGVLVGKHALPAAFAVQDQGAWTLACFSADGLQSIQHYPTQASAAQLQAEAKRALQANGLPAKTAVIVEQNTAMVQPEKTPAIASIDFADYREARAQKWNIAAALLLLGVVAWSTMMNDALNKRADQFRHRGAAYEELAEGMLQKQLVADRSQRKPGEQSLLNQDWSATLQAPVILIEGAPGAALLRFSHRAMEGTSQATLEIPADGKGAVLSTLAEHAKGTGWRVTAITTQNKDDPSGGTSVVTMDKDH